MKGIRENRVLSIIVSYNFEPWISRCLNSLLASEYPTDILVIDNASADKTVEIIRERYPSVRVLPNAANLGFGGANNMGLREALSQGYDAVFLINQDAWIEPDTLGFLVSLWHKHPEYGVLSPVHLDGSGKCLDKGFASYSSVSGKDALPSGEEVVECAFINAAFWLIPCTVVEEIGGFSPLFYHYGEDKDFVNRLHYHSYKIGYSPEVFGCHDRASRRSSKTSFFRGEYVYHLSEYANVNYSYGKAFLYGVLAVGKKVVDALCRGRLENVSGYLRMIGRLLCLSRQVYRERCLAKRKHSNIGIS